MEIFVVIAIIVYGILALWGDGGFDDTGCRDCRRPDMVSNHRYHRD
jgi:hypothetical protein